MLLTITTKLKYKTTALPTFFCLSGFLSVCVCLQSRDFSITPTEGENNKELRRLQFFGAGPKMAGYNQKVKEETKTRGKKNNCDYDPVSVIFFKVVPRHCYA